MEWTLRSTRDADLEINRRIVRKFDFFDSPKWPTSKRGGFPRQVPGKSGEIGGRRFEQVENCTGVGYYFARRLKRVLKFQLD